MEELYEFECLVKDGTIMLEGYAKLLKEIELKFQVVWH